MHILITGGTGFIGHALCPQLLIDGHTLTLLTRQPEQRRKRYSGETRMRFIRRLSELPDTETLDAVINLAGEGIADRPWSVARKQQLHASRVTLTEELVQWLKRREQKPRVLISGSAVGLYGDRGNELLEENANAGQGFMPELCTDWEKAALPAAQHGIRLCLLRTGLVLGGSGGLLKRLLPVFGLGLGGRLGSGEQWLSWIALSDLVNIVRALLADDSQSGVFNATAPKPVTNAEFTAVLAHALGRPAFLHLPAVVLKTAMGEMSVLLLGSQRVLPTRLLAAGFRFRAPTLEDCLRKELG